MFEHFTHDARQTVVRTQEHARRLGHDQIGTEHLVRALVEGDGVASTVLANHGVTVARWEAALLRRPGHHHDRQALASIGIDLDAVLTAAGIGAESSETGPPATGRRRRWSRRRTAGGGLPFSARARTALGLSLRETLRLHQRSITDGHLLLGVLREGEGRACRMLVDLGVDPGDLRADLDRQLRRTA